MWRAIALLRALPETAGATRRWGADRDSFTSFSSYLADGGLPQPRRDHAAGAAARLDRLERAQATYDTERAHEDPFILAELRTTGEAFRGQVISADPTRTGITPAGRTVLRPRFTIRTSDPVRLEPGRALISPARPRQQVQIAALARTAAGTDIVLEVTHGMGTPARPTPGAVPAIGNRSATPSTRASSRCGITRRLTRLHGRTAARPHGRPPTRPRSRSHDRDHQHDPADETRLVTAAVLDDMARPGHRGVIVDSPPGAGKTR